MKRNTAKTNVYETIRNNLKHFFELITLVGGFFKKVGEIISKNPGNSILLLVVFVFAYLIFLEMNSNSLIVSDFEYWKKNVNPNCPELEKEELMSVFKMEYNKLTTSSGPQSFSIENIKNTKNGKFELVFNHPVDSLSVVPFGEQKDFKIQSIEIPKSGITISVLADVVNIILHRHSNKKFVRLFLVQRSGKIDLDVKLIDEENEKSYETVLSENCDSLEVLLKKAGEFILRNTDPLGFAQYLIMKGKELNDLEMKQQAEEILRFLIAYSGKPKEVKAAQTSLGALLFEMGNESEALKLLNDLDDGIAYMNLCGYYLDKNKFEDAISSGEKAVKKLKGVWKANAYNNLGAVYLSQNNIEKAREILLKGLECEKGNANINLNLADCSMRTGNYIGAINNLYIALGVEPENDRAKALLAVALEKSGKIESGEKFTKRFDPLNRNGAFEFYLAYQYHFYKDDIKAKKWFLKAAENSNAAALYDLGVFCLMDKDFKKALKYFEKSFLLGYKNAEPIINRIKNSEAIVVIN